MIAAADPKPLDGDICARAERLHERCRRRARHFVHPVMADRAMDLMLSLFVAECRRFAVAEASLALANQLTSSEGQALVDRLIQAGLATATGETPARRTVGLTPLGSARMRSYIDDQSAV